MKFLISFLFALAVIFCVWLFRARRKGRIALANAGGPSLGLMSEDGRQDFVLDSGVTLPVSDRWLLYEATGKDSTGAAPRATTALGTNRPIGPSPDSPSGTILTATPHLAIYLLGAKRGTLIGRADIASGDITAGDTVVASKVTGGQIASLAVLGVGTYWVVGYAVTGATVADQEFEYVPCFPVQVAQASSAVTIPANG